MKNLILTTWITLLVSGISYSSTSFADETQYQLQVDGLVCPFCEYNVQKKLGKIEGVLSVIVNLKEGKVNVLVEDGKTLSEEQARRELNDAGFTLKSMKSHQE